ncbi:kinase-like domain-containing protein [Obelidium mucronatum]|nr:kinase-like domain-containing protein [Obelidium mucronatum]
MHLVGSDLVAKESIHVEFMEMKRDFHRVFCSTQKKSQDLANQFNDAVRRACPNHQHKLPIIQFLDCCVYSMYDEDNKEYRGVLVEKMLDTSKYIKWNGNDGSVKGISQELVMMQLFGKGLHVSEPEEANPQSVPQLGMIMEESENESDDDTDEPDIHDHVIPVPTVQAPDWNFEDFPQAFSHFTHRRSNRKLLVCDLQGVLDTSKTPPVFELTDPVIHYESFNRKNVYGRTDHGRKGFGKFYATHKCNRICSLLGLPSDHGPKK